MENKAFGLFCVMVRVQNVLCSFFVCQILYEKRRCFGISKVQHQLNEEITDSQLVRVVPGSSGLSLILSSAGQENIYWDIVGANACLDEEYIRGLESHIAKVKLLVVGFGVPYASTVLAIRLAQKHGTAVMLVAYQSRPLSDELLSMVDILVLDSREALPLADMEVTNLKSARIAAGMLLKRGVRQAVLLLSLIHI